MYGGRKLIVIERRDENGDILPLWNCPYCNGNLEIVHKEECSSLDIYKECTKCGRVYKETYVIEQIELVEDSIYVDFNTERTNRELQEAVS